MAYTTSKSLLARVRAGDAISWEEFYRTYRPLIVHCGSKSGLASDMCDELVQQVMSDIFRLDSLANFDPEHLRNKALDKSQLPPGTFRHYMRGIIRNHINRLHRKMEKNRALALDDVPDVAGENLDTAFEKIWNDEWRKNVLSQALGELRSKVHAQTYAAFELYALKNRPVEEVANFLGLSVNSVYVARTRCMETLRKIIKSLSANEE